MKTFKMLIGILLGIMIFFTVVGKAISEDSTKSDSKKNAQTLTPSDAQKASATPVANETTVVGKVEKAGDAFVIKTKTGESYNIAGQDVSRIEGKAAKIKGLVSEDTKGKTIVATSVQDLSAKVEDLKTAEQNLKPKAKDLKKVKDKDLKTKAKKLNQGN